MNLLIGIIFAGDPSGRNANGCGSYYGLNFTGLKDFVLILGVFHGLSRFNGWEEAQELLVIEVKGMIPLHCEKANAAHYTDNNMSASGALHAICYFFTHRDVKHDDDNDIARDILTVS